MPDYMLCGYRVKELEARWEKTVPADRPFVVRLDGHCFSKFTRGFKRPLDERILSAMVATTEDLVSTWRPTIGYTQSDEITLVFPAADVEKRQTHPFNGRVQKFTSILAGYASVRFNHHLAECSFAPGEAKLAKKVADMTASFDARMFGAETEDDAVAAIRWRQEGDCFRNGVSALARCHFSDKQLFEVGVFDQLAMLRKKGVLLDDYHPALRRGTFVKREHYETKAVHPSSTTPTVWRTRVVHDSCALPAADDEARDFVFRKYWRKCPLSDEAE